MANLDQILDYLADNNQMLVYEEYENQGTISISGGTAGTYGNSVSIDVSKSGYKPVACSFTNVSHASSYHPICFLVSTNTLMIVFYRGTTSAYTVPAKDVKVSVIYTKVS